jgi:hypothetical protein
VGWLLASSGTAGAHPHSYVDQQALLASSLDAMTVTIRIVPSLVEEMSAGLGMIEIAATASFTLARASDHRVTFEISYDELSQPGGSAERPDVRDRTKAPRRSRGGR